MWIPRQFIIDNCNDVSPPKTIKNRMTIAKKKIDDVKEEKFWKKTVMKQNVERKLMNSKRMKVRERLAVK